MASMTTARPDLALRAAASEVLERHWDGERGFCVPNSTVYPHLWLWDSCFHAIIWAHLGDSRALTELDAVLAGQLAGGMVPHMRYGGGQPDTWLGPLDATSSLTQPPMYGHAVRVLVECGFDVPAGTLESAVRGLDWLWDHRRAEDDLLYVVHPWEAGNDHSPRWDGWGAPGTSPRDWDRAARTAWNKALMADVTFHADGAAAWSSSFVAAPAAFNAYVAFNFAQLAEVVDDRRLAERARVIAAAMDEHLWDEAEGLWRDLPIVGGGPRARSPISDGVMGALVTTEPARAEAALAQLSSVDRFGAPYGPTNVARSHAAYDPTTYWRGAAWPHLNYLLWRALLRWRRVDEARGLALRTRDAAVGSSWAEYWNPETGDGLGAVPQSWTGLVVAMREGAYGA